MTRALILLLAGCTDIFGIKQVPPLPPDAAPDVGTWQHVAAGEASTCGIREDNTLYCWGRNDEGELGIDVATYEVDTPTQVPGSWLAVAAQYRTTCGIQTDHTLWCWGENAYGQAGSAAGGILLAPQQVGTDHYTAVTTGDNFTCALRDDQRVVCFGYDVNGETGNGSTAGDNTPQLIDSALTFTKVIAGASHACAIATDQSLWCWGYGAYGQLGVGDAGNHVSPTLVAGGDHWLDVAAGAFHSCGLRSDGRLRCWGYGPDGELGNTTTNTALTPQPVGVDHDGWASVAARSEHTCALRTDASLWCWGENDALQLANVDVPSIDPVPFQVTGGPAGWLELGLGLAHFCGVGSDHALWCTGRETGGRIGDGLGSVTTPTEIMASGAQIAASTNQTCMLDAAGKRSCWGDNSSGQLGDGTTTNRLAPRVVSGF